MIHLLRVIRRPRRFFFRGGLEGGFFFILCLREGFLCLVGCKGFGEWVGSMQKSRVAYILFISSIHCDISILYFVSLIKELLVCT